MVLVQERSVAGSNSTCMFRACMYIWEIAVDLGEGDQSIPYRCCRGAYLSEIQIDLEEGDIVKYLVHINYELVES